MHAVNRMIAIAVFLAVTVTALVILLTLGGVFDPARLAVGPWLRDGLVRLQGLSGLAQVQVAAVSALTVLAGFLLLRAELRGLRPSERPIVLRNGPGGRVSTTVANLRELLRREARRLDGVRDADVRVRRRRGRLIVRCEVVVGDEVALDTMTEALRQRFGEVLEQQVGVTVGAIEVHANHTALPASTAGPRVI